MTVEYNITMCCLGAGAIICGKGEWKKDGKTGNSWIACPAMNSICLDEETRIALGLYDTAGKHRDSHNSEEDPDIEYTNSLAYMNDHGMTWPQIADILEANPEYYFKRSV